jgi:predicted 3-demethylubiquinone-9 3-methyltransferase (glyoxalase superfamily)
MSAIENFPRITPFRWFDNNAGDAVNFYLSIFKNSRRLEVVHSRKLKTGPSTNCENNLILEGRAK